MAAVPRNEELVLSFSVYQGDCRSKHFKLLHGHDVEDGTSQARPLPVSGEDYLERCLQTAPRQLCEDICNVLVSGGARIHLEPGQLEEFK
jgi:hypothetical protein